MIEVFFLLSLNCRRVFSEFSGVVSPNYRLNSRSCSSRRPTTNGLRAFEQFFNSNLSTMTTTTTALATIRLRITSRQWFKILLQTTKNATEKQFCKRLYYLSLNFSFFHFQLILIKRIEWVMVFCLFVLMFQLNWLKKGKKR